MHMPAGFCRFVEFVIAGASGQAQPRAEFDAVENGAFLIELRVAIGGEHFIYCSQQFVFLVKRSGNAGFGNAGQTLFFKF